MTRARKTAADQARLAKQAATLDDVAALCTLWASDARMAAARASQAASAPPGPQDTGEYPAEGARAAESESGAQAKRAEDVPDEWVALAGEAHRTAPQKRDGKPTRMRHALAAVIPAIRSAALAQAAAELAKTRDGITWDDDIADSARAAYSDAINRLDAIARGEGR